MINIAYESLKTRKSLVLLAFEISCSVELSMKKLYNLEAGLQVSRLKRVKEEKWDMPHLWESNNSSIYKLNKITMKET